MRQYVIEVVGGCSIHAHQTTSQNGDQTDLAKQLAKENGRGAILSGEVQFFWADVDKEGRLVVGAFDEDLCPEEN